MASDRGQNGLLDPEEALDAAAPTGCCPAAFALPPPLCSAPRKRRAPPPTERPTADGDATTPEGLRPAVLGLALPNLARLAFLPRHRQAPDRHPVAPPWLPPLLAMAVPTEASRAAEDRPGDSRPDPSDVRPWQPSHAMCLGSSHLVRHSCPTPRRIRSRIATRTPRVPSLCRHLALRIRFSVRTGGFKPPARSSDARCPMLRCRSRQARRTGTAIPIEIRRLICQIPPRGQEAWCRTGRFPPGRLRTSTQGGSR